MVERFGQTDDKTIAERTAKTCFLAPAALEDLAPAVRLAEFSVSGSEGDRGYPWFVTARAWQRSATERHAARVRYSLRPRRPYRYRRLCRYSPNTRFDSLLAKIIVRSDSDSFYAAATKALRALRELRVDGLETSRPPARLLQSREFRAGRLHTELVGEVITGAAGADQLSAPLFFDAEPQSSAQAGARIDSGDPLAVLEHGKATPRSAGPDVAEADDGRSVLAPLQGTVVSIDVAVGDQVVGQALVVMEAMKMEHVVSDRPAW